MYITMSIYIANKSRNTCIAGSEKNVTRSPICIMMSSWGRSSTLINLGSYSCTTDVEFKALDSESPPPAVDN